MICDNCKTGMASDVDKETLNFHLDGMCVAVKPKRFHEIEIVEPAGPRGIGAEMTIDGVKVRGLIRYNYENRVDQPKRITIELWAENVVVKNRSDTTVGHVMIPGGFYCQNCSAVIVSRQGDICVKCRFILRRPNENT